ncbi:unnamed protein product [Rhizophagus irregularis]|nr:unnamed protein product [Rhizophagus irregularis]
MHYIGCLNVKYKVQSRLLRKSSEDEHYRRTIFKYEREFNIKYRDYACFISADDKYKVPIGEGVQIIFYDGKVYVCYKDTVFQPSSALRHSTEFFNLVNRQYQNQPLPSILSLYTEGGPDHRCTFGSVLNMFIFSRIMSVINYELQGVAIERDELEDEFETLKTLEDIREKSKDNPNLKAELRKCITTIQELLRERTEYLFGKMKHLKLMILHQTWKLMKCLRIYFELIPP